MLACILHLEFYAICTCDVETYGDKSLLQAAKAGFPPQRTRPSPGGNPAVPLDVAALRADIARGLVQYPG